MRLFDLKTITFATAGIVIVATLTVLGWFSTPNALPVTETAPPKPSVTVPPSPTTAAYSTPTPTGTYTPTPTFNNLPSPTNTHTPTVTATLTSTEIKIEAGEVFIVGALRRDEQIKLYETSLGFIGRTTEMSTQIGEQINGIGYGSPTNICGPLSISILQSAGLLPTEGLIPFDFWLLNPLMTKDRALLNRVFPPDKFIHADITTSIKELDLSGFSLLPGDFLYIRHGSGGNFDHMMVVTRVDSKGRPYSVTNFNNGQGYIIDEVLLYDIDDSAAGIFRKWTSRREAAEGATGYGGFELWRPRGQQ